VLQGTFDTLSFTEVLHLLANSRKTGALRMDAGVAATWWFGDGRVQAAEGGDLIDAVRDRNEMLARLVDIGFFIARNSAGTFRFVSDETPPWSAPEPVTVDAVLVEVDGILAQWREIEAVIPSLECRPVLADELGCEQLLVDAELWRILVRIDGRRSIRDIAHRTGRSVLELCRTVMELVAIGAVAIAPEPEEDEAPVRYQVVNGIVQPEEPYGPGVESPHPGPSEDRGALLRIFSAIGE
jgi:hypothetical protein